METMPNWGKGHVAFPVQGWPFAITESCTLQSILIIDILITKWKSVIYKNLK